MNLRLVAACAVFVTASLVAVLLPSSASADSRGMDVSFGRSGQVTVGSLTPSELRHHPFASTANVAVEQPDGKIVLAGDLATKLDSYELSVVSGETAGAIARLLPDGRRDLAFGNAGRVRLLYGKSRLTIAAVTLNATGQILVAGHIQTGDTPCTITCQECYPLQAKCWNRDYEGPEQGPSKVFIARLLANGKLDPSFGDRGFSISNPNDDGVLPVWDSWSAPNVHIVVQPNGSLLLVTTVLRRVPGGYEPTQALLRFSSTGMVDESWGIAGRIDIPIRALEVRQIGDTTVILEYNRQVSRFDSNGLLISQTSPPSPIYTFLFEDALSPDGTVYEIRSDQSTFGNVRLVRYLPDGSQDMNWGGDGEVELSGAVDLQSVHPLSIALDGSILVASLGGKRGPFNNRLTYVAVVSASGVVRYQRNLGPTKADDQAMGWSIDVHNVNGVLPLRSGRAVIFGNGDRSMFAIRICGTTSNCPTIRDPHRAYLSGSPWADYVTDYTFRRLPRNLRLQAGDDEVDIIQSIRHAFTIYGGSGDDYLSVSGIHLRLIGGTGNDTMIVAQSRAKYQAGSGVRALISAGPGDDRIDSAGYPPGARIRCGSGQDLVVANPSDKVSRDCERVVRRQHFTPSGSFSWERQLHL